MIRHGIEPFLECSTRGDKRLSAFAARVKSMNNMSIERLYQAAKVFDCGASQVTNLSPDAAKAAQRIGHIVKNLPEVRRLYAHLWDLYITENPQLVRRIRAASGLSDMFGQPGHACQATELWRIRNGGFTDEELRAYAIPAPRLPELRLI